MTLEEIFFVGLVIGFIYYEFTGLTPGGVIAPAYFAMFIEQPNKILMTLIIALIVWIIVKYASSYFIIFGRRRLLICLVLGFSFKLIIASWIQPMPFVQIDLQSVGYIIPGLIANDLGKQSFLETIASIGIVMAITYLIVIII